MRTFYLATFSNFFCLIIIFCDICENKTEWNYTSSQSSFTCVMEFNNTCFIYQTNLNELKKILLRTRSSMAHRRGSVGEIDILFLNVEMTYLNVKMKKSL